MNTLDFQFRDLAAWLTIGVVLYGFIWRPALSILLSFSVIGLGPAQIFGDTNFAKFAVFLQGLAIMILTVQLALQKKLTLIGEIFRSLPPLYVIGLAAIWVKIGIECVAFGMDDYKMFALKYAAYAVGLPPIIFMLCYLKDGLQVTLNGIVIGAALLSIAYLLPLVYPILTEGRLISAAGGETRLTTFGQDTINGGRMFFVGSVGLIFSAALIPANRLIRSGCLVISALFFICLILNGSRQFIIAALVAAGSMLYLAKRFRQLLWLLLIFITMVGFYSFRDFSSQIEASQRFAGDALAAEASEGRGRIWADAFALAIENPVMGVGFRNFGQELVSINPETGDVVMQKDNAHGFFQEVFVEHGLILGFVLVLGWIGVFYHGFRDRARDNRSIFGLLSLLSVFAITETFSGGVFNCVAFHFFAVAALIQKCEKINWIDNRSSIGLKILNPQNGNTKSLVDGLI